MSLRVRLTLTVAVIVALAVVAGAYAAHSYTREQLRSQADDFLVQRAERFAGRPGGPDLPGLDLDGDGRFAPPGPYTEYDAVTQLLLADGSIGTQRGQPALPVDASDKALAASGGDVRLRDVTVDGVHYRMITVPVEGSGSLSAVQIARSLDESDTILDVLRRRLILIALLGTVAAGLIAWIVVRRATRPIEQLTQASERIAETQDLATPIPVSGDDEVGRLARSFNTMLVALDTSREQQKRLIMDASHELRTPLTAVRTNIDFLQRAGGLELEARMELIAETRLELDELTNLVSELVELATDVRSDEPVEALDIDDVVAGVVARYRRRSGREISVAVDAPAVVQARRSMLDRGVSNLVDNALKFSPAGTPVEVRVHGGAVDVLDRGPGVPAADREHVFDRFYRATSSRTLPGSGLGLAIVKQVAEVHGGTVAIGDRPGGGTVATITLPEANGAG